MSEWILEIGEVDSKRPVVEARRIAELVRCKDCSHWDEESTFCLYAEGCYGLETKPNWFCADGERRSK